MGWNELEFLSWHEFKQMAPSILQLEVRRIEKLIPALQYDVEDYNILVRARFMLKKFILAVQQAGNPTVLSASRSLLQQVILTLTPLCKHPDRVVASRIQSVLERIGYVQNRCDLLY